MSEVTLQAIGQLLDKKLDEKLDIKLKPIKDTMSSLATSDELSDLSDKVATMETTLSGHTTSLSNLLSTKKAKDDKNTVSDGCLDRLEHWGQKVGKQIGLKLEL